MFVYNKYSAYEELFSKGYDDSDILELVSYLSNEDDLQERIEELQEQNQCYELESDALYQRNNNCLILLQELEECKLSKKASEILKEAINALENY